jgi:glucokinase
MGFVNMKFAIGFDLGGTKLAAALVDKNGVILDFTKVPVNMSSAGNPKKAQKMVLQLINDLARDFKRRYPSECSAKYLEGIGLASAGPMNVDKGVLINPANFPGWKTFPLLKEVQNQINKSGFKTQVRFQNDAIAAALAEGWVGSARKMSSYALVTIGTGIGSGLIINGRPCQNKGAGSEFGHLIINFPAVQRAPQELSKNTVEGIASGTALIRKAHALGFIGNSVEELVLQKDKKYQVLFDDMAWALATLCFNLSVGFHLDGIFFSGGLIKVQDRFLAKTLAAYKILVRQFNPLFECPIKIAKTKNKAGVLGAAYLPFYKLKSVL